MVFAPLLDAFVPLEDIEERQFRPPGPVGIVGQVGAQFVDLGADLLVAGDEVRHLVDDGRRGFGG